MQVVALDQDVVDPSPTLPGREGGRTAFINGFELKQGFLLVFCRWFHALQSLMPTSVGEARGGIYSSLHHFAQDGQSGAEQFFGIFRFVFPHQAVSLFSVDQVDRIAPPELVLRAA